MSDRDYIAYDELGDRRSPSDLPSFLGQAIERAARQADLSMAERYEAIARDELRRWGECGWTSRDRLPPLLTRNPTVIADWQPDGSVRIRFTLHAGIGER